MLRLIEFTFGIASLVGLLYVLMLLVRKTEGYQAKNKTNQKRQP